MKNIVIISVFLVVILVSVVIYFSNGTLNNGNVVGNPDLTSLPRTIPVETEGSPNPVPTPRPNISKVPAPLPTGDGRTTFIDETVPWSLLLTDASCELKGEIKFLNSNTYDNQDALFTYKGVDHPARNVFWTVTPQDAISVGPNIFSKIPIPNGESLLGVVLPENPKYKKYEITAKIQYGRQVDAKGNFVTEGGNVKVSEKQCAGKTTVVLPQ